MPRSEIVGIIVEACRRRDGWGRTFYRADGLTDEPRRHAARATYLDEHPETSPANRDLIRAGGVTPGMTKAEVTAAWGLLEEDLGALAGRSTADERHTYEWWSGFDVGERESYELFYTDGVLVGIKVNEYAGPVYEPTGDSDRETDKKISWLLDRFWYFYVDTEGYLRGATIDPHDVDYETLHLHLYTVGLVPPYTKDIRAARQAERKVRREGRWAEYVAALANEGADARTAHPEQRCRAVLSLYPKELEVELTTEGVNDERTRRATGFYKPVSFIKNPSVQEPRRTGFDDEALRGLPRWVVGAVPPGRYAMWWPTEYEQRLTYLSVAKAINGAFWFSKGIEPYVYTALLNRFGLVGEVESPLELPEELRTVFFKDDHGNHFVFSASKEKGLRFHFPVGEVAPEYRNTFWYRFNASAEAWREAVEASGAPLYENDTGPFDWWSATYRAVRVAEGEGGRVEVVGALVL